MTRRSEHRRGPDGLSRRQRRTLDRITRCSCGSWLVHASQSDPIVCPHIPDRDSSIVRPLTVERAG